LSACKTFAVPVVETILAKTAKKRGRTKYKKAEKSGRKKKASHKKEHKYKTFFVNAVWSF